MAGGADDDYLDGGDGATTFYFRSDEAGWDEVTDQHGMTLNEFALRAGFSSTPSNLVYGGKYRMGGETSFAFQIALEAQVGGSAATYKYYDFLRSVMTFAELELSDGGTLQYPILGESTGFPRGVPDPFFRGPYVSDGYDTWVYNSIADMMRDLAALGISYNPADIQQIPGVADLSEFTANNYSALRPYFDSGMLDKDVLKLDRIAGNSDELIIGFAPPDYEFDGRRYLRLVWGEDKVIDTELPSAADLIGYGIEEVYFGNEYFYIGDLVEYAQERGYIGTPFDDILEGTAGDDKISGLGGWDFIDGGAGNDWLSGGAGIDEFFFQADSGTDTIVDPDAEDIIVFGNGVTPDQIRLGLGSLRLGYGNAGDAIHFQGFNPNDVHGSIMFSALQFYDTDTWTLRDEMTYEQVLSLGFDIAGTPGDDVLTGTNIHDRFEGGAGNDLLAGGSGSDTYFFSAGDGVDTIVEFTEANEINRVVLRDYQASDISGFRDGNFVVLRANGTQDEIRILWNEGGGIGVDLVEFSNGATWDRSYLNQLPGVAENSPPVVAIPVGAVAATEDSAFNFVLPAGTFLDPDAGDVLSYVATLSDGGALPAWLSFDAATRTFAGTPENDNVGKLSIRVTATDGSSLSASDTFELNVLNTNDAPVLAVPLADAIATQNSEFQYTVPAGIFVDVDAGDVLTYSATRSDGSALPAWLHFDATGVILGGTPGNSDVGTVTLRLTATDLAGAAASTEFSLTVTNINDAPVVVAPVGALFAAEDAAFSFTVPSATFTDIDAGDTLSYSAALEGGGALPAWLSFDGVTRSFAGMPLQADVGVSYVSIAATDASGASAFDTFSLTVTNVNDAPLLARPVPLLSMTEETAFSYAVPADTFFDEDTNDVLSLSLAQADGSALPSWLTFNPATGGLNALAPEGAAGNYTLRLTATDVAGAQAATDVALQVRRVGLDLTGTAASETLSGSEYRDVIDGAGGNDILFGLGGNDRLLGGEGKDRLYGGTGDDRLDGGAGDDYLEGGTGSDTYLFGRGSGKDVIADRGAAGQIDVIQLGAGISLNQLKFDSDDGDLTIRIAKTTDRLTIRDWRSSSDGVEELRLADGQTFSLRALVAGADDDHGDRDDDHDDDERSSSGGGDDSKRKSGKKLPEYALSGDGGSGYHNAESSNSASSSGAVTGKHKEPVEKNKGVGGGKSLDMQSIIDALDRFTTDAAQAHGDRDINYGAQRKSGSGGAVAVAGTPGLTQWTLSNALTQYHLSGSKDGAGEIDHWFARNGGQGLMMMPPQYGIGAGAIGAEAHSLQRFTGLQDGMTVLR